MLKSVNLETKKPRNLEILKFIYLFIMFQQEKPFSIIWLIIGRRNVLRSYKINLKLNNNLQRTSRESHAPLVKFGILVEH